MSPAVEDALTRWVEARRELDSRRWQRLQGRNLCQDAYTDIAVAELKARNSLLAAVDAEFPSLKGTMQEKLNDMRQITHYHPPEPPAFV